MRRRYIELIEFSSCQPEMKRFSEKSRYKEPFVIETNDGCVHTVTIKYCEYTKLYYFATLNYRIEALVVVAIEDRIWDHIRN